MVNFIMAIKLKYNKKDHPEDLVEHMSKGYSISSWCAKHKISRKTFDSWLLRYREFKRAHDLAKTGAQSWWEDLGRDMALGGNAATYIFNMKNRFGWADKQDISVQAVKPALIIGHDASETNIKIEGNDIVELPNRRGKGKAKA